MNIFATDECPYASAQALDDKRINKMLTESVQMLSTATYIMNRPRWDELQSWNEDAPHDGGKYVFKPTHANHPCNVWVRASMDNFLWLHRYAAILHILFQEKSQKKHRSAFCLSWIEGTALKLPYIGRTPFCNAARNSDLGFDFAHITPTTEAYRLYLNARWPHDKLAPTWKERKRPDWCTYEAP